MFDVYRDIFSRILVIKYNILSNIGNISVNNDNGNNIKLTMGTIIIFNIILRKFISYEVYIFIGNDTKKDIRDIYIIFSSLLELIILCLFSLYLVLEDGLYLEEYSLLCILIMM